MSVEPPENGTQEQPVEDEPTNGLLSNRTILIVGILAVVGLLIICILSILLYRSLRDGDDTGEASTPGIVGEESAPANVPPIRLDIDTPTGPFSVTLESPISLSVDGESFVVQTQVIGPNGIWDPVADEASTAVWVYGSIVNYIVGIPDLNENRALLERLAPGDEIMMSTRGGAEFTFSFNSREEVPNTNQAVFAQNTPGITLLLLESAGSDRLVVHGRYVVSETDSAPGNVVSLGETAQLGNVQLTVNSTAYMADRTEIPPGFAFFLVDYQIQNVGLTALDSSKLQLMLVDKLGNQYVLSPVASGLGNTPPLGGFLNANQVIQATAGYQVPLGLTSDTLSWVVTQSDSGNQVYVTLPFTGGTAATQATNITLFRADVTSDLTGLILGGQITNLGTQPVVVTESDVSLRTDDGAVYLLLSNNPPFPWTVPPGQTLQFFFTYQRPPTAVATFEVLNQGFQLTGLR
jgi:hypothetical protein